MSPEEAFFQLIHENRDVLQHENTLEGLRNVVELQYIRIAP